MRGRHGNHARSSDAARWSELPKLSSSGHVKVRVGRGHPLADPNGYAYEHLVVWVSAGNARPAKGELLHHKNGVKTDNRIENLELLTRAEHNRMHNADRPRGADGRLGKKAAGSLLDGVDHKAFP